MRMKSSNSSLRSFSVLAVEALAVALPFGERSSSAAFTTSFGMP